MTLDPDNFAAAVAYAASAHAKQTRKRAQGDDRPGIPYISHPLGVAALVLEDLGSEAEAIAGLLHDVLEDQDPDRTRAAEIERIFGADVRALVQECTGPSSRDQGMANWWDRKQVYLAHLASSSPGAVRVALADKVHNARCTVNDLDVEGPTVWDRFNSGQDEQLRWYGALIEAFARHGEAGGASSVRVDELRRLVARMAGPRLTPSSVG